VKHSTKGQITGYFFKKPSDMTSYFSGR